MAAETTDPEMSSTGQHVVIDVEPTAGDDDDEAACKASTSSSCAVCMEPMEWVAVTPCGHGEVCVMCAARLRFVHNDRRCCICRSHCAAVVITRAGGSTASTTTTQPGFPAFHRRRSSEGSGSVVVGGVCYWYHGGMGAYFDDLSQFQEMSKVCAAAAAALPSSEKSGGAGGVNQQRRPVASVNAVDGNVVSAPARQEADAALEEFEERPLSREEKTAVVILAVIWVLIFGLPLLYMMLK